MWFVVLRKKFVDSNILVKAGLILLFLISSYLRFTNLSYSEFQDDEKKTRIRPVGGETVVEYLLSQRKGPMQFLVAFIPYTYFEKDGYVNELAIRLPFTIASLVSVFVLYAFVHKLTKSHLAALFVSLLYSVNGFVVGFSRIAQYQNLNLLFSFLALYFYSDLVLKKDNFKKSIIWGTIFISLSVLSHWDAAFYIVPIAYFFISFLLRKDILKKEKVQGLLLCFGTFLLVTGPFLIPYVFRFTSGGDGENVDYLFKRVGAAGSDFLRHKYIFELYNPVITIWLYFVGIILSLPFIKKAWVFVLWFLVDILAIKFFMVTPKTHIYNYVIPALVTSGIGFYYFFDFLHKKIKKWSFVLPLLFFVSVGFLVVQSYQIFVDHTREYPYDEKKILWHINPILLDEEIITFGFPHNRKWKEIDKVIPSSCKYITNESKGISQIYVKADYGENKECFYIVVIKKPFYTKTQNVKYAGVKDSKMVYKYERDGETLVKVYKMK